MREVLTEEETMDKIVELVEALKDRLGLITYEYLSSTERCYELIDNVGYLWPEDVRNAFKRAICDDSHTRDRFASIVEFSLELKPTERIREVIQDVGKAVLRNLSRELKIVELERKLKSR